jgi:hypothetical protein
MSMWGLAGDPFRKEVKKRYHGRGHNIEWCHSWDSRHTPQDGVEWVPMLWGDKRFTPDGVIDYWQNAVKGIPRNYAGWLIFINEPTLTGQSDMTPSSAAALFARACEQWPKARFTSPQMTIWHSDWDDQLERAQRWLWRWWVNVGQLKLQHRVKAWAWHNYDPAAAAHIYRTQRWGSYVMGHIQPLEGWVTEWSVGGEVATRWVSTFLDGNTNRHAYFTNWGDPSKWWVGDTSNYLFDFNGQVTPSGRGWGLS